MTKFTPSIKIYFLTALFILNSTAPICLWAQDEITELRLDNPSGVNDHQMELTIQERVNNNLHKESYEQKAAAQFDALLVQNSNKDQNLQDKHRPVYEIDQPLLAYDKNIPIEVAVDKLFDSLLP